MEKNQEIQESLKGFHEEREKLHQSHVAQQVRLKFAAALEKAMALGQRGVEGWKAFRDSSSKVMHSTVLGRVKGDWYILHNYF